MQSIPIDASWFEGAVSVAAVDSGLLPFRLPWKERELFHRDLHGAAYMASGVRLRFATDAETLELSFVPLWPSWLFGHHFDLTIDGKLVASAPAPDQGTQARFTGLPQGEKTVEIWFPQGSPVFLREARISDGASARVVPDPRPKWVTYGSSITHCVRSLSPARTWPAAVARARGLNLLNLGYGGQAHLETPAAMMIRDLPADLITLKLGINTINGSLNQRTFYPAVTGLVRLIREQHTATPIVLISPIAYPPNEIIPNAVGMTLQLMRTEIERAYQCLVALGDAHLYYLNGLELFDEALLDRYSDDQCHPKGDGQLVMAERFIERLRDCPILSISKTRSC